MPITAITQLHRFKTITKRLTGRQLRAITEEGRSGIGIAVSRSWRYNLSMTFKRTLPDPVPRDCRHCGKTYTPERKRWRSVFCSVACQRAAVIDTSRNAEISRATAERRGNTLRGRGDGKSYRKLGGRHEHRVIAEQKIGRSLLPGEIVHHIDGNRFNNDPENLVVITQSAHARGHSLERWRKVREAKGGDA